MPKKDPTNKEILKAIKNLAKGQQSLNNKLDALEKGQQSLNNKVGTLEKGQQSLNNKVGTLEKGQQSLNNKLDSLTEWTIREITTLNGLTDSLDKKGDILIEDSAQVQFLRRKRIKHKEFGHERGRISYHEHHEEEL